MIIETAHAKINFTLSVGSKRADGYHSIDSLMHSISLSDRITLTKAEAITLSVTEGEAPLGRENLMVRAAERFFEETGLSGGVSMTLAKRIPSEAGMGGGSSDAATVLRGLDRLYETELSLATLARWGGFAWRGYPLLCGGGGRALSGHRREADTAHTMGASAARHPASAGLGLDGEGVPASRSHGEASHGYDAPCHRSAQRQR